MKQNIFLFCWLAAMPLAAQTNDSQQRVVFSSEKFTLHSTPADSGMARTLLPLLEAGTTNAEQFFGRPFPHRFDIFIFPNRAALDRQWQQAWGDSSFQSACWMVASGVGARLDLLSPNVWTTEACEHRFADTLALRRLLAHELVHTYHGQHHANPNFDGMDELGWWVEGIATYASGQLTAKRLTAVHDLVTQGSAPKKLADMWSGPHRYGLAGSLAAYVDRMYGREMVFRLLTAATTEEAMRWLGTVEGSFLEAWKAASQ